MTSYLVDVNVWLALCSDRHVHHGAAHEWFQDVAEAGAAFCRLTQLGVLRLLTNAHVMGSDVLSQAGAWQVYDTLCQDTRVTFVSEPPGLDAPFRSLTQSRRPSQALWTDAYLAALAVARGLTVVSFDRGFQVLKDVRVLRLPLGSPSSRNT